MHYQTVTYPGRGKRCVKVDGRKLDWQPQRVCEEQGVWEGSPGRGTWAGFGGVGRRRRRRGGLSGLGSMTATHAKEVAVAVRGAKMAYESAALEAKEGSCLDAALLYARGKYQEGKVWAHRVSMTSAGDASGAVGQMDIAQALARLALVHVCTSR